MANWSPTSIWVNWLRASTQVYPFPGRLIAQTSEDVHLLVTTRLYDRTATLSRHTGVALSLPPLDVLRERLQADTSRLCTLHMDLRPANVIARDGWPLALIDWDNALRLLADVVRSDNIRFGGRWEAQ